MWNYTAFLLLFSAFSITQRWCTISTYQFCNWQGHFFWVPLGFIWIGISVSSKTHLSIRKVQLLMCFDFVDVMCFQNLVFWKKHVYILILCGLTYLTWLEHWNFSILTVILFELSSSRRGKVTMTPRQEKKMSAKRGSSKKKKKRQSLPTRERIQTFEAKLPQQKKILIDKNLLCYSGIALTNIAHWFIRKQPLKIYTFVKNSDKVKINIESKGFGYKYIKV